MSVPIGELLDSTEERMMKTIESMEHDFSGYRTGKASPALVENMTVEYYGTATRLKELAGITTPEARLLVIQPWDPTSVTAIERAIIASSLGISPVSDGRVIRLPIPELSQERRQQLARQVRARAEEARVAIRNIRREGNDEAKKAEKGSTITEDELKAMLEDIQKLTDDYIKQVDGILEKKEKELMTV
jgi:ribosome recycling factor